MLMNHADPEARASLGSLFLATPSTGISPLSGLQSIKQYSSGWICLLHFAQDGVDLAVSTLQIYRVVGEVQKTW
jgi:hypothetical protein